MKDTCTAGGSTALPPEPRSPADEAHEGQDTKEDGGSKRPRRPRSLLPHLWSEIVRGGGVAIGLGVGG